MKKLQLLLVAVALLVSVNLKADTINSSLNLNNPDVRKCLIEAAKNEGWKLEAYYFNTEEKLVMVFGKDDKTKVYMSK